MRWIIKCSFFLIAVGACFAQPRDPRDNATPYWHSDGRIFFKSQRDGGGVFSVKSDGKDLQPFIKSSGDNYPPRWTHDETRGVFMTNRDEGDFEIYVVNADRTGQKRLTFNKGHDWDPGWSPNGKNIVFMSSKDGNWEIYKMDRDGSNQVRLTNNTAKDFSPAFSPDGKKILFASDRGGNEDIYTMNADGTGAVALAPAPGFDGTPEWSHDGKKIIFHSRRDGGKAELYVMNADGTNLVRLTNNDFNDVYPVFSPNGKKIAFQSDRDGYRDIFVMNVDGTDQKPLIANRAPASANAENASGTKN